MNNPAETLRLKIHRANAHVDDLKAALGIGPKAIGPAHTHGIGLQDDGTLHYSTDIPIPGTDCGIIFGDAIHQLRAVLDHLICALASRHRDRSICEKLRLQFPIHKDLIDFCADRLVSQGTLKCILGSSEFSQIEESQPYKRQPINPTSDPLYILSKLDNIDKHRVVLVFDQRLHMSGFFENSEGLHPFKIHQPVKPGTQVLDFSGALPQPPFGVHVNDLTPFIVLSETDGVCDGRQVFALFRDMESAVVKVIDRFEPFFSTQGKASPSPRLTG